jgi:hypothetical protein
MAHPCQTCGACCATWAVQIDRSEVKAALRPHVVPARTDRHAILTGTEAASPRCAALDGVIGVRTRCTIYAARPSPCREVRPSYEDGTRDASCHEARVRHGLAPLRPRDWVRPDDPG